MKNNFFSFLRNTLIVFLSIFSFSTFYGQQTQVQIGSGCLLNGNGDLNGWTVGIIDQTTNYPSISLDGADYVVSLLRTGHYIQSPVLDVTDFANINLNFDVKATTTSESEIAVYVSISKNGGPFEEQSTVFNNHRTSFIDRVFQVNNLFSFTDTFQIRLHVKGSETSTNTGSRLKNIRLFGIQKSIWQSGEWVASIFPSSQLPCKIQESVNLSDLINSSGQSLPYLTFESLLLTDDAVLTIDPGKSLIVVNDFSISDGSSIIVENNANFIQLDNVTNTYPITVKRNTSPLKRLDYVLWSSPIADQNLQEFSPQTLANRFYTYNPLTDYYNLINPVNNSFEIGKSYLIRTPDNFPSVPTSWEQIFSGVPNNGDYYIEVVPEKFYALGNPYPSDLDLDFFASDNFLAGPFYFWRKTNNSANPSYATYMPEVGGAANSGSGIDQTTPGDPNRLIPDGICPPGQGFIVKTTPNELTLSEDPEFVIEEIYFSNGFRTANALSDVFLRSSATNIIKNRLWLNLSNVSGLFSQALVAYTSNSTLGLDSKDALVSGATPSSAILSSVINDQPNYIIQARGDFMESDVVPLSLKAPVAGDYTISLADFDGTIFENVEQGIFLKDNYTNSITNLKEGAYTFATNIGDFLNRFEVLFQNTVLSNNDFNADAFVVYSQNENNIVVNGANQVLSAIKIFDSRGRLLSESKNINVNEFTVNISASNELLLIQITNESGYVVTKKIIH